MNKKAFVTGGSRGIGKGIVHALAKEGYDVVFTYASKKEVAEQVVKEIRETYHTDCDCIRHSWRSRGPQMLHLRQR